jgi:ribonuclease HI
MAKFGSLKANKLNHAGRLQYIKSVLSSIPVYYMSVVLFSKTFIDKINTIIRRFWWAGVQEEQQTSPIAYRSWEDICKSTDQGGLGIRDIELINKSLIIQSAWNIATNKNPFLTAILKAKYYPDNTFWTAPIPTSRSVYWSSILQVKHHLHSNATLQIHAGNSSIWSNPWIPIWQNIHDHILLPVTNPPLPATVSDLWMQGTKHWDHQMLSSTFSNQFVQVVESTPVVDSDQEDILRWTPATNGQCSSKAAYTHLVGLQQYTLPLQGSRGIHPEVNLILQKVWKGKTIPPFLKTFAWRLIRRALATAERAGRYSSHIDQHCTYCGAIENDVHLFFLCDLPRQVWATSDPPLPTHNISPNEDEVQLALPILITSNPSESFLSNTLFTLWYIWKARNDNRFQRKTWSTFQVNQAAKAHRQTHLSAMEEQIQAEPAPTTPQPNSSTPSTSVPGTHFPIAGTRIRMERYLTESPSLLRGTRCYTDASTLPNPPTAVPRAAGLGIFIVNNDMQPPLCFFIKAAMQDSLSVLMAESTALALAANLLQTLELPNANLLSDSQQLVHFLNGTDLSNPPDWRIKPYTQLISSVISHSNIPVRKINRTHNQMADSLARQALRSLLSDQLVFSRACTNPAHVHGCPLLSALHYVTINSVMVLSASCC